MPPGPSLLVAFAPPPGWATSDDAPPDVDSSGWVTLDAWHTWRVAGSADAAVLACFGSSLDSWTPEATPLVFDRLDPFANATLARLGGAGTLHVMQERKGDVTEHSLASDTGASARTFVGFTAVQGTLRVEACFAGCTTPAPACLDALARAARSGASVPPPSPNAAVSAVVRGIHHPRAAAATAIGAFVLAGALLVWRRPRGRRK